MTRGLPETKDRLRLASVLCARLCHDLSGSLGTVLGTIELARESRGPATQDALDEALALAGESAATLGGLLRLLRAAWGADPAPLPLDEFRALAAWMPARRATADLSRLAGPAFDPAFGQVALNLLLLGGESLPGGGTVTLAGDGDALLVTIEGPRAAWPERLAAMIAEPETAWAALDNARTAQAPLAVLLARAAGISLKPLMAAGAAGPSALLLEA